MTTGRNQTIYRRAAIGDIDTLTRFRLLFLKEMHPDRGEQTHLAEVIYAYFARTIPTGLFIAYLAFRDGLDVGVGGMVVYELPPSGDVFPRKTGSLVTMYTTPPARKSGVAGGILDCLIEEARNSGLIKLHLSATDQEVGLYRKAGFSSPLFSEMEPALEPE